jgi:hypothetical protein
MPPVKNYCALKKRRPPHEGPQRRPAALHRNKTLRAGARTAAGSLVSSLQRLLRLYDAHRLTDLEFETRRRELFYSRPVPNNSKE